MACKCVINDSSDILATPEKLEGSALRTQIFFMCRSQQQFFRIITRMTVHPVDSLAACALETSCYDSMKRPGLSLGNRLVGTIDQSLVAIVMLHERKSPPSETAKQESCNQSGTGSSTDDDSDEAPLPPPRPYYARELRPFGPSQLRRTKSETFSERGFSRAKDSLTSQRFNQSMPDLHSSRAQHNRRMGSTGDFRADDNAKASLQTRVDEFEFLLTDL